MPAANVSSYEFTQLEGSAMVGNTPAELLANARAEAERMREQVYADSLASGHAEGLRRAEDEAASSLRAAAGAMREIADTRAELVERFARQAGELALQIAEQLVAGAFAAEPERVIDVARAALRRLSERHRVTVLVNPDDMELIADATNALKTELGGIEHLEVQADRRIERGGVIARTAYGEIDATIAVQLASARELVLAALDGDSAVPAADAREESARGV